MRPPYRLYVVLVALVAATATSLTTGSTLAQTPRDKPKPSIARPTNNAVFRTSPLLVSGQLQAWFPRRKKFPKRPGAATLPNVGSVSGSVTVSAAPADSNDLDFFSKSVLFLEPSCSTVHYYFSTFDNLEK